MIGQAQPAVPTFSLAEAICDVIPAGICAAIPTQVNPLILQSFVWGVVLLLIVMATWEWWERRTTDGDQQTKEDA